MCRDAGRIEAPEDATQEEKTRWEHLIRCYGDNPNHFLKAVLEFASKDDKFSAFLDETNREKARDQSSSALANCPAIMQLSTETVLNLFQMPAQELRSLAQATEIYQNRGISVSADEVEQVVATAVVRQVMEDYEKRYPGPTGSQGPQGSPGITGVIGAQMTGGYFVESDTARIPQGNLCVDYSYVSGPLTLPDPYEDDQE